MDLAQSSLRAASPPAEHPKSGCQKSEGRGIQNLMGNSASEHFLDEAEKIRPETWVPTARIAYVGPVICQVWICIDEPRRGSIEWRAVPCISRLEAESEGPVSF